MDIQQELSEAIRLADRGRADALLEGWAREHGWENLIADVLDPLLATVGEDWHSDESFTLAQAYVAAKVTEDALGRIAQERGLAPEPVASNGPVIIGNIEEDFHALGRKMVGTFLRAAGWLVTDLGNDVSAASFVDAALEAGARVIGVSAMTMTTAHNITWVRQEIDRRGATGRLQLAVGGAVFRICPELVEEIGADGTAAHALAAPELFDRLWARSLALEALHA